MNTIKNKQLIDGIIAGDNMALKSIYKKNLPIVRRWILNRKGTIEDVEDIFQEALVLLYHKLKGGDVELYQSVHTYFIGICKNLWRNHLRKKQLLAQHNLIVDIITDPSDAIIDTITRQEQQQVYQKHFKNLSEPNKNVLTLFFEGKSMRDIAAITGYSEGYTRKKKFKIKERLLELVQNDPIYEELVAC